MKNKKDLYPHNGLPFHPWKAGFEEEIGHFVEPDQTNYSQGIFLTCESATIAFSLAKQLNELKVKIACA